MEVDCTRACPLTPIVVILAGSGRSSWPLNTSVLGRCWCWLLGGDVFFNSVSWRTPLWHTVFRSWLVQGEGRSTCSQLPFLTQPSNWLLTPGPAHKKIPEHDFGANSSLGCFSCRVCVYVPNSSSGILSPVDIIKCLFKEISIVLP